MCWLRKKDEKIEFTEVVNNEEQISPEQEEIVTDDAETFQELEEESAHYGNVTNRDLVVLLDNGHASSTAGKRSPKFEDGTQLFEYEFNRDIVARLSRLLDAEGIHYEILVPEVDTDIALSKRVARANAFCDKYGVVNCLFISVHANAYGNGVEWTTPNGWEVYTCVGNTKSDAVATMFWEEAKKVLPAMGKKVRNGKNQPAGNDGPDYEANFTVLVKTNCPAILTENMFYTNKEECEWLLSDEGREAITQIHLNGIKRWIASKS